MIKRFTPINILWIEDNPLWKREICSLIKNDKGEKVFNNSLDDESVPIIQFDKEKEGYEKYFSLKILQHPEEIKEYYSLCHMIEDKHGAKALGVVEGIVPEMVVFDYKLSENITINQSGLTNFSIAYSEPTKEIRQYVNPNFPLLNKYTEFANFKLYLEDMNNIGYDDDLFINRVYKGDKLNDKEVQDIKAKIKDDEFGLYGGIEIVKYFRHHACVGIPATANKADKKRLHPLSRHYEWLNEYDLSTSLDREERDNKSWDAIIKDGTTQLVKRIDALVQSQRISPSLNQLLEFADCDIKDEIFSFSSIYGIRHLPLNGLFIYKSVEAMSPIPDDVMVVLKKAKDKGRITEIKITEREYEIWRFATNLLRILSQASGIEVNTIDKAKTIAEHLWNAATTDILKERFRLSELFAKKYLEGQNLTADEADELENLCSADFYNVIDCDEILEQIQSSSKPSGERDRLKAHVNNRIFSIREYHTNDEADNKTKIILATLFLAIRLEFLFKSHSKKNNTVPKVNSMSADFGIKPSLKEFVHILFPSPRMPILMPAHLHIAGNEFKSKILEGQYQKFFSRPAPSGINWSPLPNDLDFSRIVTSGERIICQSYAASIGLLPSDYPNWLK